MKVARSQLRRIIREERNRLLSEQNNTGHYGDAGVMV